MSGMCSGGCDIVWRLLGSLYSSSARIPPNAAVTNHSLTTQKPFVYKNLRSILREAKRLPDKDRSNCGAGLSIGVFLVS